MQFTTFLLAALSIGAAVATPTKRDIVPPIISPTAGEVFTRGDKIAVMWDTSSIPAGAQNTGKIYLGFLTDSESNGNLDTDHPLAEGFLLTNGKQFITFPFNVAPGPNTIIALADGDATKISGEFTLE